MKLSKCYPTCLDKKIAYARVGNDMIMLLLSECHAYRPTNKRQKFGFFY